MKNDHNLDDLIIDDVTPTKSNGKGILTIVALLVSLLIIAVVMTRLFMGESSSDIDPNFTIAEEKRNELSPDLKLDTSSDNPASDLEADKRELDKLSSMMEETIINHSTDTAQKPAVDTPYEDKQIKPDTAVVDETQPLTISSITNKKPAEPTKPVAKKPTPKPATTKSTKPNKVTSATKYYIQVGSFTKKPSSRFLSVISKNGFTHELKKGKLLIGPYSSDRAARRDLPKVKNKINKGAFIKHY